MTNNIRVFLWLGLGLALYFNFSQWQMDYAPKATPSAAVAPVNTAAGEPAPPSIDDAVPQASQTVAPTNASAPTQATAATPTGSALEVSTESKQIVHVTTDVLEVDIDLKGGTLVHADLPGYPLVKGESKPVVLFNHDAPTTTYLLRTGLIGATAADVRPTHTQMLTSAANRYDLAPGQEELRVPLTWTDGQGVTVTKTFIFHRSLFSIRLEYAVDNKSAATWTAASYARLSRSDPAVDRSMFKIETMAFRGPAIWAPENQTSEKQIYRRLDITKAENQNFSQSVKNGWLAGMQHHFVTAVVPEPGKEYQYTLQVQNRLYVLSARGPTIAVAPGTTATLKESIYIGPKLQKQLAGLHKDLDRVADYSWLYLIAKPLFWLLEKIHGIFQNWGVAIILATLLLKLLFYPLSEKAGRSMARMRALTPRLKQLQETYKDDRAKLGQVTMDLYRSEKVNPVAGCLPMLIQAPVFLAFYWVLLESAEMRQAPFLGWINDLSSRDPYFILPILNGAAMWFQQKLNPPPPDPMQARLFQFMPVVFTVMFAFFPAGLVLYWVTNTGLTILQQWNINRKILAEEKTRKR